MAGAYLIPNPARLEQALSRIPETQGTTPIFGIVTKQYSRFHISQSTSQSKRLNKHYIFNGMLNISGRRQIGTDRAMNHAIRYHSEAQ
jgi:hypothetical protein